MTETTVNGRSFYDHTHPDSEYFGPNARCTVPEPAVDDIRMDPANLLVQEKQEMHGSG